VPKETSTWTWLQQQEKTASNIIELNPRGQGGFQISRKEYCTSEKVKDVAVN